MKSIKKTGNIGKKGIADNFLALLGVGIGLAVIFGFLFFVMYSTMKTNETIVASDLNIKDGLYTTRILLNQEVRPGYKVYDLVIDTVNTGDYDTFQKEMSEVINRFYPEGNTKDEWKIIINYECYIFDFMGARKTEVEVSPTSVPNTYSPFQLVYTCSKSEINMMPRVTVPNPEGDNILVIFKQSNIMDSRAVRIFGSRADQLNGIAAEDIPVYSNDGRELMRIENIPSINCDESATVVGKICAADEDLVRQLQKISAEELQPKGWRIEITQAYRTYEIQKNLYDQNCNAGTCKIPTCNPDAVLLCPHMQAGAIDLNIFDENNNNLNQKSPDKVESLMCKYGFVRFRKEDWHFEYGTNKWEEIKEKEQETGKRICSY